MQTHTELSDKKLTRGKRKNPSRKYLEVGQSIRGTYRGFFEKEIPNRETGELRDVRIFSFEDLEGELFSLSGGIGLKQAIEDANVVEGDLIEIERLENRKNRNGKGETSTYDIFTVES